VSCVKDLQDFMFLVSTGVKGRKADDYYFNQSTSSEEEDDEEKRNRKKRKEKEPRGVYQYV
jgi:hypothetical protein